MFTAGLCFFFVMAEGAFGPKHDMTEAFAWGQEFQLGYHQHPPFWAWVCGIWFSVVPRTEWGFALLSALNAGLGLWGAWSLIGDFARGPRRIAGWALLLLTPFYTVFAYKYNANIIFISLWPWTLHYFVRSLRNRQMGDAIAFGLFAGAALMSKYFALILLATCFLGALRHPARRRYFSSASPWITTLTVAVVSLPHVIWLVTNDAPPIQYFASVSGRSWGHAASFVLESFLATIGTNLAVAALILWAKRRDRTGTAPEPPQPEPGVLPILAFTPLFLALGAALAFRVTLKPEMLYGIFPLVPMAGIELARLRDMDWLHRISVRAAIVVTAGTLLLSPGLAVQRVFFAQPKPIAPNQEIAREATRIWRERTGTPLAIVGGSAWYDNAIAFFSPDQPHALPFLDYAQGQWVTPALIARLGILSVCTRDDQPCLDATAQFATAASSRVEVTVSHVVWGHVSPPVSFILTIVPPKR